MTQKYYIFSLQSFVFFINK